jgi:hypothetical protein
MDVCEWSHPYQEAEVAQHHIDRVSAFTAMLVAGIAVAAPVSFHTRSGLQVNAATACGVMDGTCCPEVGSICLINPNPPFIGYYYLASGSCKES